MKPGGGDSVRSSTSRRDFLRVAAAGTAISALGGLYVLARRDDPRAEEKLPDGRPRLPPGQRAIDALRPMGGEEGSPDASRFSLRVHGEVESPFEISFADLLALPQAEQPCDVHCVTGWSLLGARFRGVRISLLAERARVRPSARHVVFEAAHGYTANVPLEAALAPDALVAHALEGRPLGLAHGAPARALVPSRYFWKSAKWLRGVRFSAVDAPGYWEIRGYHNDADPWKEERYA